MKRLLTAVVLIPIVLLLTFKAPLWLFCGVVCVVAMLAMREYMQLVIAYGYEPLVWTTYIVTPLYFALLAVLGRQAVAHSNIKVDLTGFFFLEGAALVLPVAFFYALVALRKGMRLALPSAALTWTGFVLVVFALATLIFIRVLPLGSFCLLYLFVVVWLGDSFAFWIGKSIGKHKLAPEVSPGKTWEGAIASVVAAACAGAGLLYNLPVMDLGILGVSRQELYGAAALFSLPLWKALLGSALINIAAQFGDLVESMMKRGAGVKDSGAILPGHGGMLDRVDALLFAAPVGFVIILFAIHS